MSNAIDRISDNQATGRRVRKGEAGRLLSLIACAGLASFACSESPPAMTAQSVVLGEAANFLVLGASTVTNTGPTVIGGDLGLSPGTSVSGFPPGLVNGSTHVADGLAGQAQTDMHAAWTTLRNTPCTTTLDSAELGGLTLTPGVYCFTSPSAGITGALTLDAEGRADAVFVFLISSTLTTATDSSVLVINGGSDCNVFWVLGSSATLGTGSRIKGNILASASITLTTGATVSGRLLAHTGAVTLDSNTVQLSCMATPPVVVPPVVVPPMGVDAGVVPPMGVDAGMAPDAELPTPPAPFCGDGVLDLGEQCDDGNEDDFDRCTTRCIVQT